MAEDPLAQRMTLFALHLLQSLQVWSFVMRCRLHKMMNHRNITIWIAPNESHLQVILFSLGFSLCMSWMSRHITAQSRDHRDKDLPSFSELLASLFHKPKFIFILCADLVCRGKQIIKQTCLWRAIWKSGSVSKESVCRMLWIWCESSSLKAGLMGWEQTRLPCRGI